MSLVSSDLNQATPDKATIGSAKSDKPKPSSPLAELKNGKVLFKQKPISFENLSETMQEIVSFRACVEAVEAPLATIPDSHLPLIAKLVHESDKSAAALTKALHSQLLPPTLEPSSQLSEAEALCPLTPSVVENAIKTVAERVNYGIDTDSDKHPAALCVWRWEVKNKDWMPKSVRDKVCQRFQERVAAKKHLQAMFEAFSEEEREVILQTGKNSKSAKGKEAVTDNSGPADASTSSQQNKKNEISGSHESSKKAGRPKKTVDAEAIAKEKEKQEKRAIKAEKEKKAAEATKKSAAVFANFFKAGASAKPGKSPQVQSSASSPSSSTTKQSEFELTFKPFAVKKGAHLASVNWFVAKTQNQEQIRREIKGKGTDRRSVIELDDEGRQVQVPKDQNTAMDVDRKETDVSGLSAQEVLRSFLDSKPPSLHPISCALIARRHFKADPQYRVRAIMHQLNDAEVQGDQRTAQRLTGLLTNRRKVPAKVLIFAENNRPGYLGTWTRSSSAIGPRTPLARDLLTFDYDHDSDAEWEEEEVEGGRDDVDSLDGSLDDDMSSAGSDMASWLVEGDEIEIDIANPQDEPDLPTSSSTSVKRKAAGSHEAHNKKRKVVPLIPFQKGPIWEKELGDCEYEAFKLMRIQFFNDTPFPIDPFTFVADPVVIERPNNPASKNADGIFAVPAIPDRLLATIPAIVDSSTEDSGAKRKAVHSALLPKTSFPDAHVLLLLQRIDASNTNSFAVLLDSLFQDLKPLGIKKNALEVKLREVSEKDKTKKGWVVKEDAWTRHGLIRPV